MKVVGYNCLTSMQETAAISEQRSRTRQRKVHVYQHFLSAGNMHSASHDAAAAAAAAAHAESQGLSLPLPPPVPANPDPSHSPNSYPRSVLRSYSLPSGRCASEPPHLRATGRLAAPGDPPSHPQRSSLSVTQRYTSGAVAAAAAAAAAGGYRDPHWMNMVSPVAMYLEEPGEDEGGYEGGYQVIDPYHPDVSSTPVSTATGAARLAVHGTQSMHAVSAVSGVAGMWGEHGDGRPGLEKEHSSISQGVVQRAGDWAQKRLESLERQQSHVVHALHRTRQSTRDTGALQSAERNLLEGSAVNVAFEKVTSGGVGSFIAQALVRATAPPGPQDPTVDTLLRYRTLDVHAADRNTASSSAKEMHEDHVASAQKQVLYEGFDADEHRDARGFAHASEELQGGAIPPRGRRTPLRLAADAAAMCIDDFDSGTYKGLLRRTVSFFSSQ